MNEQPSSTEITRVRADGIVTDLKQMFKKGLDPKQIAIAHGDRSKLHQDMLRVQLGLKPAASYLLPVFGFYILPDGRFAPTSLEKPSLDGIAYDSQYGVMWRPDLVKQVIEDPRNAELVGKSFSANPALEEAIQEGYDSPIFSAFLATLSEQHEIPEQLALAGLLYGIPREAALQYGKWNFAIDNVPPMLWREATALGYRPRVPAPEDTIAVTSNRNGVRDEFVRLLRLVIPESEPLATYLELLRLADIPGHPFITSGDLARGDETQIIAAYDASEIEQKLKAVFDSTLKLDI
jgi:hypothetical protein